MRGHYGTPVKNALSGTNMNPSCLPPFERVLCFHVLTVKTNFLSEDNKVSVRFIEVQGCSPFVNNIRVDVFSLLYCSTRD